MSIQPFLFHLAFKAEHCGPWFSRFIHVDIIQRFYSLGKYGMDKIPAFVVIKASSTYSTKVDEPSLYIFISFPKHSYSCYILHIKSNEAEWMSVKYN